MDETAAATVNPAHPGGVSSSFSLTQAFNASVEDVILAMWRRYARLVRGLPRGEAKLDPAPVDGIQCLNLPLRLTDWPAETPNWVREQWSDWRGHHSWVMSAGEMLWRWVATEGTGEIRGSTRYTPGLKPHTTLRHLTATLFLENADAATPEMVRRALHGHFEQEHAEIRKNLIADK